MKTLLATILCFASISYLRAGDKETYKTYYFFNSLCSYTYSVNTAAILTLYKDSSFAFEIYSNKYSETPVYSAFSYAGNWKMNGNNHIELKYNTEFAKDKSEDFGFTYLPYQCNAENENLLTDSKSFPKMYLNFTMNVALGEKWRYEQFSKKTMQPGKLTNLNFPSNKKLH